MQEIKTLATKVLAAARHPSSTESTPPSTRNREPETRYGADGLSASSLLFKVLSEQFGRTFTSQYLKRGGSIPDTWRSTLDHMPPAQFKRGLQALADRPKWDPDNAAWPPVLSEFLSWCWREEAPQQFQMLALPEPESVVRERYDSQRDRLRDMRKAVGL